MNTKYKVLIAGVILAFSALAISHGGGHPTRYVAEGGVDEGECATVTTPCASISYAVDRSQKGDKVWVAAGKYVLDELEVFYMLSDMIALTGGYSLEDGFKKSDPDNNLTTIEGIPYEYREDLAKRGFHLLSDSKGLEGKLSVKESLWMSQYKELTTKKSAKEKCVNGKAGINPCSNIDKVAHIPLSQFSSNPSAANDIWGFVDMNNQREYAIIGVNNGTTVFDVTNAENPVEVGHINGARSSWRDLKVYQYFDSAKQKYQAYAYVTTEAQQGLQIIDLSKLPNSISLAATMNSFRTAHNVYVANVDYSTGLALPGVEPYLYIAGSNLNGGVYLTYDLKNPLAPKEMARGNAGYVHDITTLVIDDARTSQCQPNHNPCELLVDFNENTVDIWDMTDKGRPVKLSSTAYSKSAYTHSGWWSDDKMTIFIQDELDEQRHGLNTTMRAMDISDLKNPKIISTYTGPTAAIDHNGFTLGDYYYMSNYRRGLTVLDVSDPRNMREVGFFDTFAVPAENTNAFNGAWGTYPYLASKNILVSDVEYGLWVVRMSKDGDTSNPTPAPTAAPTAAPTPVPTAIPTPVPTSKPTPVPVPTAVPTVAPTATPRPDSTLPPLPDPGATPVPNPGATLGPIQTPVPVPAPTQVPVPVPTATPAPVPTAVPVPTPTPTPTPTPGATATPAPGGIFGGGAMDDWLGMFLLLSIGANAALRRRRKSA